jgi:hypothetical protein
MIIEDTLPDLRVTIAESMEALADARLASARRSDLADLHGESTRWWAAKRGAETLRWCAAHEAPSVEELLAEIASVREAHEEAEEHASDLVDNVKFAASKWEHAQACQADDAPCICALAERRKSVLDAVA